MQTAAAQGLQVSQVSGSPALRISRPEAQPPADDVILLQALESEASVPLAGKAVCASLHLRAGTGFGSRAVTLKLIAGTGTDESSNALAASGWTDHEVI